MPLGLFPYQEEGAAFLAPRWRAGLFDAMGIGKSAETIRALDIGHLIRGMIVCPASVREHWRSEFGQFSYLNRRIVKGVTIHDFVAWSRGHFDVLVTSYELATKWTRYVHEGLLVMDFLVFDEGHYLKSGDAIRTHILLGPEGDGAYGLAQWAKHTWWLTGTPIPNDPMDIYTFCRFVGATNLYRHEFKTRYFIPHYRRYGSSNEPMAAMIPEIQAMIGAHSIRRKLDDVGVQLPPIFLTRYVIDGNTEHVRSLLSEHPGLDRAIVQAVESGEGIARIYSDHVATLRRLLGEAKALPYAALLYEELHHGGLDKMVVFGVHRDALTTVRDYLWQRGVGAVLFIGGGSERERVDAVRTFQENADCRVFISNIRSGGTGLTLTASAAIDIFESDWSPAGNAQAIKRCHRLTQTRSVRARFMVLADSFDVEVSKIVRDKTAAIADIEQDRMPSGPTE